MEGTKQKVKYMRKVIKINIVSAAHLGVMSHSHVSLLSPLVISPSVLGERKRTKDLLLGPDLYTFLVLFFSPRPLSHTKGL